MIRVQNLEYEPALEDFRNTVFLSFGKPSLCFYQNQNLSKHTGAVVIFDDPDEDDQEIFHSNDNVTVEFALVGGSDFPRFIIRLRQASGAEIMLEAVFRPFSENFSTDPNPTVNPNIRDSAHDLRDQRFHFSDRMNHLTVTEHPTAVPMYDELLTLNGNPMLKVHWTFQDVVIFDEGSPSLLDPEPDEFDSFKKWV
ncbi:MAG: hypothetical protein Q9216_000655 [Gyalolechia sp. 2 TL-2023]